MNILKKYSNDFVVRYLATKKTYNTIYHKDSQIYINKLS